MWSIIVGSKSKPLNGKCKDFVADLIDSECHSVNSKYGFILHNILETKNFSEVIIEGKKCAARSIKKVLMNNTKHQVICKHIKKSKI